MVPKFVLKGGAVVVVVALVGFLGHNQLNAIYRDHRIDANEGRLNKSEETIEVHGKTLVTHESTLDQHTKRLGEHDGKLTAHEGALETHETQLEDHDTGLKEAAHERKAQGRRLSEFEGFFEVTQGKLGAVEKELKRVTEELERARAKQARQEQVQEHILERLKTLEQTRPGASDQ
jgi:septal ring factor EnvC (AmiA/AmiB activator)